MARQKTGKRIRFSYPLSFGRGLVDGRYPIIRIEKAETDSESFVYFRVNGTVYVGYSMFVHPKFAIVEARKSKRQDIQSFDNEMLIIPSKTKARSRKKIGVPPMSQERPVMPETYWDEKYSTETVEDKRGRLHVMPVIFGKGKAESIARDPKQIAENKEVNTFVGVIAKPKTAGELF